MPHKRGESAHLSAHPDTLYLDWTVGDVIRKLRQREHWTLEQLSEKSRVSLRQLHRIEIGDSSRPLPITLKRIAKAFHLPHYRTLMELVPRSQRIW